MWCGCAVLVVVPSLGLKPEFCCLSAYGLGIPKRLCVTDFWGSPVLTCSPMQVAQWLHRRGVFLRQNDRYSLSEGVCGVLVVCGAVCLCLVFSISTLISYISQQTTPNAPPPFSAMFYLFIIK